MSGKATQVDAFFADLDRLVEAQVSLFESGDIGLGPAQHKGSVLPENQGDLEIFSFAADEPGWGWGGTVLKLVAALADRHGLDIYLKAEANDEEEHPDSIPQPELELFYAKRGFRDIGNWSHRDMIRRPRGPEDPEFAEGAALLERALGGEVLWTRRTPPAP